MFQEKCDYTLKEADSEVVTKWYYDNLPLSQSNANNLQNNTITTKLKI